MDSSDQANHGPDPAVLAQFWTACSRVHSQASASSVAELVVQAVRAVRGVAWCSVCVRGLTGPVGGLKEPQCAACTAPQEPRYECSLEHAPQQGIKDR